MAIALRQSTASQEIPLGYFVDSTDGNTEETGLTIANTDIRLWKNGATTLANKNSGGATHISNGIYYAVLDATDTNTLGPLIVFCHVSGALAVRVECLVLAANVYDSLIAASDALQVHTNEITADLITAAVIADNAIDAGAIAANAIANAKIADGAITAAKIATDAIANAKIADGAITAAKIAADAITAAKIAADAIGASELAADAVSEIQSGLATAAALSTVDGNVSAIKAKTDNLPADPADDSDIDTQLAAIAGYIDTEIAAIKAKTDNLPASPAATGDIPSTATVADAVWDEALSGHTGSGSAGEALAGASAPSAATVADAVWDEALSGHTGSGSAGKALSDAQAGSAGAGSGAVTYTYTLTSAVDATAIPDADVWVTSDAAGTSVLASGRTNSNGQVTFYLDTGTVYIWRQKAGWNFTNPQTATIS